MLQRWLFLAAYACSGLAGLIYEVSWTRLLTLYMGHTTAAASAVVAAFMGGLALGAGLGGRVVSQLTRRECLVAYIALEIVVVLIAVVLPFELSIFTPILSASYQDGAPGLLFPAVRLLSCLAMMFVPAVALGATFPVAVRWYVSGTRTGASVGRSGGALYAANTAGAAAGALVAGFVLIPAIGVTRTTMVGVAASTLAIVAVLVLLEFRGNVGDEALPAVVTDMALDRDDKRRERRRRREKAKGEVVAAAPAEVAPSWLAAGVLGVTGLASLIYEIAWTRVLSLTIGPTIYAFSATLAVLIAGLACGSAIGAWVAGRTRSPATWLALILAAAAMAASWACTLAGGEVPRRVAEQVAASPDSFDRLLTRGAMLIAALIFPTAACLGAAFPLAFATMPEKETDRAVTARLGLVYSINTVGAVAGSLLAGFVFIPHLGLQQTLHLVSALLILASMVVVCWGPLTNAGRLIGTAAMIAGMTLLAFAPPWDRELLASGGYIYAPYVPKVMDLESALKAGTLLYYREGASATVSVKKLTGTLSLAIDGKVDASTRSDMLTQKIVAHLPLLLHEHPKDICVIGLGSGVTLGSVLRHPAVEHADVVELSPEVVEASQYFAEFSHHALEDPRTRLILGDGRSHLLLSKKQYDVIISEPSNPWIAGVASLFTREFFAAARNRLAPGGIICQWAHTYNISDRDLRSIVATFTSVFPNGTVWMIGDEDVLLVASASPLDARLANVALGWQAPAVAADLAEVGAREPFALWSLFVGGPAELSRYANGSTVLTDDRSALEFSAPRELHSNAAGDNAANLVALLGGRDGPPIVRRARQEATAAEWRNRGAMMFKSDMFSAAYDDDERALAIDPGDRAALRGLVESAVMAGRTADALGRVKAIGEGRPATVERFLAQSRLLAALGISDEAVAAAKAANRVAAPGLEAADAHEQLASLYADASKLPELDAEVDMLRSAAPDRAAAFYYAAVSRFLHGQFADTVALTTKAIAADPAYAATYDLAGAAYTKVGDLRAARNAFELSLRANAHDSSAYANLGLLELSVGSRAEAARDFAEALWLDPHSTPAREGLARTRGQAAE